MTRAYGLSALLCALWVVGCADPTAVRRTLLIPAPSLPARVGKPLDPGHGRAAVELSALSMSTLLFSEVPAIAEGEQGEPGVLVPRFHLGGHVHIGLFPAWEIGARVLYTHSRWARRSFSNVIALPENEDRGLYELALTHRFNVLRDIGPEEMLHLAVLAELGVGNAPEAIYCQRDDCDGPLSADARYVVDSTERRLFWRPQLAVLFGAQVHEKVFVDVLLGTTTSMTNVGFDRLENIDEDTVEAFWVGYLGSGIDVQHEWAFANLHVYVPLGAHRDVTFGPRLLLQTGYAF